MKKYQEIARRAIMQNLVTLLSAEPHQSWKKLYTDCLCDMLLH